MKSRIMTMGMAMGSACLFLVGSTSRAEIITNTSSTFDIGLGYSLNAGVTNWNDSENSGTNTPTTQGSFTFVPTVVSPFNSAGGVSFSSRTLGGGSYSANGLLPGGAGWTNTITASYLGSLPAGTTNVQLQINITGLGLWISRYSNNGGDAMGFVEVTPGHGSSSPTITDTTGGNASTASTYVHLTWDPTDFAVDGTNATRTFGLTGPATADMQVDGYEVFGNVQAIFATIPEPSTALLTGMVILFGLAARRRR